MVQILLFIYVLQICDLASLALGLAGRAKYTDERARYGEISVELGNAG
jgi:hypothetical protein